MQHGDAHLQSLVENQCRDYNLAYLAVIGLDGKYLAHSASHRVGTKATEPAGATESWGDVQRVRFVNEDSAILQEYRAPLRAADQNFGTVRLAIIEPNSWHAFWTATHYAPIALIGPFAFLMIGAVVLGKLTRPVEDIDRQLRRVATAPSVAGCELLETEVHGPAAIGWNRLVHSWSKGSGQKDLQERLSESLSSMRVKKLEMVLDGLSDGISTTDQDGSILLANSALAALIPTLGQLANEGNRAEPSTMRKQNGPNGSSKSHRILDALKRGWVVPDSCPLVDPETTERPVVVELEGHFGEDRRILRVTRSPWIEPEHQHSTGHLWTFRDITQQKLAEEMRNQFVNTATHELRTPLANIKAYAETLVLADVPDIEQQKDFLNTISAEATRLARFVDDLLSVSRMEVGSLSLSKQTTNLARLLDEAVKKVRPLMKERKTSFDVFIPEKMPELYLDKDKITTTLVNLLGNAIKYTPQGGHVALRVKVLKEQLEISVEDTGIGISQDEIKHVFDKFFRSKDSRVQEETGSGLGLPLAYEVVRLHGGTITVESVLDKGSTFTVILPLVTA
ncbi:MAG: hypothetical protein JW829_08510 [Pirellulales bacterium]|nr:hypothetical protein [Pirellulales bacterium]